tara:strand:+ start:5429 stop:6319 length:891 start_codon:yes stop_codon:yes gene_type:complete
MDLEFKVIGIAYAICAGILFLGVVPYYAVKHLGGENVPPIPKGRVPIRGFGLPDIIGVSLLFGFYAGIFQLSRFEAVDAEPAGTEGLVGGLMFNFLLQFLQIAFVLMMLSRRVNLVEAFGLRWRSTWWKVIYAPVVVFVMWAFMFGLDNVGYNEWLGQFIEGDGMQESVKILQETTDPLVFVSMGVVACIGAPLAEEVVFRGYIYTMVKRMAGLPLAVILSGVLFGAVHMNLVALLPLTVLGIILALSYEYTGSLWAPIAIHFCFNAGAVAIQTLLKFNPEWIEEIEKNAGFIPLW